MKKLMFLTMSALIIMAGCSKDNPSPVSVENNQKNVKVTRSLTLTLEAIPEFYLPHVECLPEYSHVFLCGGGSLQGNVSEAGNVVTKESPWRVNSCEIGSDPDQVKEYISGTITAISGDALTYSGFIIIDIVKNTLKGSLEIEGGTGKFIRSSGVVDIEGQVNAATSCSSWIGIGSITLWI